MLSYFSSKAVFTLLTLSAAWLHAHADWARPLRNSVPLSVLLCQYTDSPTPSDDIDFYRRFFTGLTGLDTYWLDISNGAIDLDGSVVSGWYTIDKTVQQARDTNPRTDKHKDCVDQAKINGYTPPNNHIVVVVTSPFIDTFGLPGLVTLGEGMSLSLAGHEVGHGMGFRHSFTEDARYCNADWAAVGEYGDPWDVMSHADTFQRSDVGEFRRGGPGLNAYHRDRMGTSVKYIYILYIYIYIYDVFLYILNKCYINVPTLFDYFSRMDPHRQDIPFWCRRSVRQNNNVGRFIGYTLGQLLSYGAHSIRSV